MRIRPILTAAALAAASLGIYAAVATSANAAVTGNVITTSNEAGYLAYPNLGDRTFTQLTSVVYIRKSAEQLGNDGLTPAEYSAPTIPVGTGSGELGATQFGAIGLEACDSSAGGDTAQLGIINNDDGTFDIVWATGTSAVLNTHCAASGLLTALNGTTEVHVLLSGVAQGDTIGLLIKHTHGISDVVLEAQNDTLGQAVVSSGLVPFSHAFNEIGGGVLVDPHLMTASLDNELVAIRGARVTNRAGTTAAFGNSSQWTAEQVRASNSGSVFLSPNNSLHGQVFTVWGGQPVV